MKYRPLIMARFQSVSSNNLYCDLGNSRVKWQHRGLSYVGVEAELLGYLAQQPPERLFLSAVRPFAMPQLQKLPWQQAQVSQDWQGFHLDYRPEQLGVDRWLAMLALRERLQAEQVGLLVDMGTATTLDLLRRSQHLGGLICAGFSTSKQALLAKAHQLQQAQFDGQLLPAHQTDLAIGRGYYWPILALIHQWQQQHPGAKLLLTGGDAGALLAQLPEAEFEPDLVVQGLELWSQP